MPICRVATLTHEIHCAVYFKCTVHEFLVGSLVSVFTLHTCHVGHGTWKHDRCVHNEDMGVSNCSEHKGPPKRHELTTFSDTEQDDHSVSIWEGRRVGSAPWMTNLRHMTTGQVRLQSGKPWSSSKRVDHDDLESNARFAQFHARQMD